METKLYALKIGDNNDSSFKTTIAIRLTSEEYDIFVNGGYDDGTEEAFDRICNRIGHENILPRSWYIASGLKEVRFEELSSALIGIMYNNYETTDKCGHDVIGDYTIDTCFTHDQGYETAIYKSCWNMAIVERYDNNIDATAGHAKWCEYCKTNPEKAYSVQFDEYITL